MTTEIAYIGVWMLIGVPALLLVLWMMDEIRRHDRRLK